MKHPLIRQEMNIIKTIKYTIPKIVFLAAPSFVLCFLLLWVVGTGNENLSLLINIFEILYGLITSVVLLFLSRKAIERYNRFVLIGTALAVISWSIGQVFWFSYSNITDEMIPYPSVGDMGYTGTYFFLIGVIVLLLREQPATKYKWYSYSPFFLLSVPVLFLILGDYKLSGYLYNFILVGTVCFTLFYNFRLLPACQYRWFVYGVFMLGIADVIFMVTVCLFPNTNLYLSDILYCFSIALIAYGSLKGVDKHD